MNIEQNIIRIERELAELKAAHAAQSPRFQIEKSLGNQHAIPVQHRGRVQNYAVVDTLTRPGETGRVRARFFCHNDSRLSEEARLAADLFAKLLNEGAI